MVEMIDAARSFRFCGPSDDPDEQTAVTTGYRYVLVQIQRLATPLLPEAEAARLNAIAVDVDSVYSAYDAKAELDALLPHIEADEIPLNEMIVIELGPSAPFEHLLDNAILK